MPGAVYAAELPVIVGMGPCQVRVELPVLPFGRVRVQIVPLLMDVAQVAMLPVMLVAELPRETCVWVPALVPFMGRRG